MEQNEKSDNITDGAENFHASNAFIRVISGGLRSARVRICCMEIFDRASQQNIHYSSKYPNGKRLSRWAIVADARKTLMSSTIKDWREYWGGFTILNLIPSTHGKFEMVVADKSTIEIDLWFLATDTPKDMDKLRNIELTAAFLNNVSTTSTIRMLAPHVGRYPHKRLGGSAWGGIIIGAQDPVYLDDDGYKLEIANFSL